MRPDFFLTCFNQSNVFQQTEYRNIQENQLFSLKSDIEICKTCKTMSVSLLTFFLFYKAIIFHINVICLHIK